MTALISGTYTVVSAKTGAHRTVAILDDDFEWMTSYRPVKGTRVVKAMLGSDNERLTSIGTFSPSGELRIWSKHQQRNDLIAALKYVIAKGAEERVQMGKTYAVMSKRCFICNRKLTNPASHFYGYGPDCAEQNGLPYNASVTGEGASAPEPASETYACRFCGKDNVEGHACNGANVVGDVIEQASAIAEQRASTPTHCVYKCSNKRCSQKGKAFTAMSPADTRLALGHNVLCPRCGDVAWFVNVAPEGAPQDRGEKVGYQRVARPRTFDELFGTN